MEAPVSVRDVCLPDAVNRQTVEIVKGIPVTRVVVDGKPPRLVVDTGAPTLQHPTVVANYALRHLLAGVDFLFDS